MTIIHLERSQTKQAGALLADVFNTDPMFRFLVSEAEPISNVTKLLCKLNLRYCQPYNHIYTTEGLLKGVAAWVPPENTVSVWRLLPEALALLKLDWRTLGRCLSLVDALEKRRKTEMPQPHWHLELLGVAPAYQGQGIGGLLLQPVLRQADREGLSCYLATSTQQAVRFYQKQGFDVIESAQLTKSSPTIWTMKRSPLNNIH